MHGTTEPVVSRASSTQRRATEQHSSGQKEPSLYRMPSLIIPGFLLAQCALSPCFSPPRSELRTPIFKSVHNTVTRHRRLQRYIRTTPHCSFPTSAHHPPTSLTPIFHITSPILTYNCCISTFPTHTPRNLSFLVAANIVSDSHHDHARHPSRRQSRTQLRLEPVLQRVSLTSFANVPQQRR